MVRNGFPLVCLSLADDERLTHGPLCHLKHLVGIRRDAAGGPLPCFVGLRCGLRQQSIPLFGVFHAEEGFQFLVGLGQFVLEVSQPRLVAVDHRHLGVAADFPTNLRRQCQQDRIQHPQCPADFLLVREIHLLILRLSRQPFVRLSLGFRLRLAYLLRRLRQ